MKKVDAITLFVEDLLRAKSFYEDVFGAPIVFEDENSAAFGFEGMIVNLLSVGSAPELIEPVAVASPDAGVRVQLTVGVEDVDAACTELECRGVELLNGPVDRPWGIRTAAFRDPGGHVWEIAHELS